MRGTDSPVCGEAGSADASRLVPVASGRDRRTGPVAAPDPALWADPTRRRVLLALAELTEPVSLAELATGIGGHPNTTRAHLEALRVAGLVARTADIARSPGRPAWLHLLTDLGRSAARRAAAEESGNGPLEPGHDHIATAFIRHLAKSPDAVEVATEVGREWGASLPSPSRARTRAGRRRAVQDLFDRMGFTPVSVTGRGVEERVRDEFSMRSCPLLDPARENPEIVCSVHRGLVAGYLEQTGAGPEEVSVDLDPWGLSDGCRLALTWRDDAAPAEGTSEER